MTDPFGEPNPYAVPCQVCNAPVSAPCNAPTETGRRDVTYFHLRREDDAKAELERVIRERLKAVREQREALPDLPTLAQRHDDLAEQQVQLSRALARLMKGT